MMYFIVLLNGHPVLILSPSIFFLLKLIQFLFILKARFLSKWYTRDVFPIKEFFIPLESEWSLNFNSPSYFLHHSIIYILGPNGPKNTSSCFIIFIVLFYFLDIYSSKKRNMNEVQCEWYTFHTFISPIGKCNLSSMFYISIPHPLYTVIYCYVYLPFHSRKSSLQQALCLYTFVREKVAGCTYLFGVSLVLSKLDFES